MEQQKKEIILYLHLIKHTCIKSYFYGLSVSLCKHLSVIHPKLLYLKRDMALVNMYALAWYKVKQQTSISRFLDSVQMRKLSPGTKKTPSQLAEHVPARVVSDS